MREIARHSSLKWRRDLANANQSSMISQSFFAGRTAF